MTVDDALSQLGQQVGDHVGHHDSEKDRRTAPHHRQHECDRDPDEAQPAEPREIDEEPVEPADPVKHDPVFEVLVPGQAGTSCLARSISCCGSNGLPTKPRAPRCSASPAEFAST